MKIVVVGATGKTGRLVVEQALMRGDQVVAYVRNPYGIVAMRGLAERIVYAGTNSFNARSYCSASWKAPGSPAAMLPFYREGQTVLTG
jgi:NAD(P)-dependent dehydrogenase (short-subunit alcohol dehydrogenase family)